MQSPRGMKDILPDEIIKWQYVEDLIRDICKCYNFKEIRTPVCEYTELFQRGVGDETDIVQKEMYTFLDKGGRSLTLRPEGTAGVARSFIEHGFTSLPMPIKLYYFISAHRYENVQKGRLREHHQFGIEVFGSQSPLADAEIISLINILYSRLGLKDYELRINNIGCPKCRPEYINKLKEYNKDNLNDLCETCKTRYEKNTMRILDCKEETCKNINKNAPKINWYICSECEEHFKLLQKSLNNYGIEYIIDSNIVRGLDYYTKTVFEFVSKNVGTQGTLCGGGRYDGLIQSLGGTSVPAVGFGMGLERLFLELDGQGIDLPIEYETDLYIATIGQEQAEFAQKLCYNLRKAGLRVEMDLTDRGVKSQLKYADKINSKYVIVIGDEEMKNKKVILKNMRLDSNDKSAEKEKQINLDIKDILEEIVGGE